MKTDHNVVEIVASSQATAEKLNGSNQPFSNCLFTPSDPVKQPSDTSTVAALGLVSFCSRVEQVASSSQLPTDQSFQE